LHHVHPRHRPGGRSSEVASRRSRGSALAGRCLPAFAPRFLLLLGRPALLGAAAGVPSGTGLLATAAGRAGGVADPRGPLLGHALLLQAFVLLLVLDVGTLRGHVVYLLLLLVLTILCPLLHVNMPSVGSPPCRIDAPSSWEWRRPTTPTCPT